MYKRIITGIISLVLMIGYGLNAYSVPPYPGSWHQVSQPTGETFRVYLENSSVVYAGVIGRVEIENKLRYTVILAEDGFWYYYKIKLIAQYKRSDDKTDAFIITNNDDYRNSEFSGNGGYVEYYNTAKYLIDSLPVCVQSVNMDYPFTCTETTEEEKAEMEELIRAERRRLGKTETSAPNYESPGPECFITEMESSGENIGQESVTSSLSTVPIEAVNTSDSFLTTESELTTETLGVAEQEREEKNILILILVCSASVLMVGGGILIFKLRKRVDKKDE